MLWQIASTDRLNCWPTATWRISNWGTVSLKAALAHEMLHGVGLEDQYIYNGQGNPICNPDRTSLMDGWYTGEPPGKLIFTCDGVYTPASQDITQWSNYMVCCNYEADTGFWQESSSGVVTLKWKDNAWTDYYYCCHWA